MSLLDSVLLTIIWLGTKTTTSQHSSLFRANALKLISKHDSPLVHKKKSKHFLGLSRPCQNLPQYLLFQLCWMQHTTVSVCVWRVDTNNCMQHLPLIVSSNIR